MGNDVARFIKNLVYSMGDSSTATATQDGAQGMFKPLQSNALYIDDLVLPDVPEDNLKTGQLSCKETNEIFVWIYNKNNNHTIYRLNCSNQTFDIVYQRSTLNLRSEPEFHIHDGGAYVEVVNITNPDTLQQERRTFLFYTDGFNDLRFICVEDSIATNGFDPALFPFFAGNYDPAHLINFGVPTPSDCIVINEVPNTTPALNNNLLYNTFQFRLRYYDVWGRPSEYGIISDLYIPGGSDCISASSGLPRCVDLTFDSPLPHINQVEVAYRKCNDQQWYTSKILDLYEGSSLGQWWLRQRNSKVTYNNDFSKITYRFCNDADCKPISPTLTNRITNPIPRITQSIAKVGSFISASNNKDGFFPFSSTLRDKFIVSVLPPSQQGGSNNFRNIFVLIEIENAFNKSNQPIYRQSVNGTLFYGFGVNNNPQQVKASTIFKQYFKNEDQKGFIGYLAGTGSYAISVQYSLNSSGVFQEVTDFDNLPSDRKYFQAFSFNNVPAGTYIFRLASHQADPTVDDYVKTSTYTVGSYGLNFTNSNNPVNNTAFVNETKELIIDVCAENYDSRNDNKILVVWDLVSPSLLSETVIFNGYIYDTNDPLKTANGVELLQVKKESFMPNSRFSAQTDFNGFYFVSNTLSNLVPVQATSISIHGYCGCSLIKLITHGRLAPFNFLENKNFFLNENGACVDYETQKCNFILIKGTVKLCNSDIGVPGVLVILSRGKYATTDANGNFTIVAFDDTINTSRLDKLYYIANVCSFKDCNDQCIQPIQVTISKCITCDDREIIVNDTFVFSKSEKGLLSGATYPIGTVGWDIMDRPTFVQTLGNINTPSVQELQTFSPSIVKIDIAPDAIFPIETKYITFWIGSPADIADYFTWIVDKVEFIDNTGLINNAAPTQIRIYYASLIEYNQQNNFNTTVNWQFIDSETNSPVLSDRVTFLLNGDGQFFSKSITSLVKYAQDGQYFLVNYTSDLADLKENAIIRVTRPKICTTIEFYFEVCSKIKITNRKAETLTIFPNFFDTYYIHRQIPVPVTVGDETVNQLRIFGVPFEHNSPSDFWGQGCKNIGRFSIENPQESEIYHPEQIRLTGALSETGLLNFLNFFEDSDTKVVNFSDTALNGIVSVLPQTSIVLVIGQSDFFIVGYKDNLARVNEDGTLQASNIAGFGQPQRKLEDNFGCQLRDKNTISSYEGKVCWLDTFKSMVIHNNYSDAIPLSKDGADSYLRPKVKFVQEYNLTNNNSRYFVGIINPINFEYILTDCILNSTNYINSLRQFDVTAQETVSFDILNKSFKASYSFLSEGYAVSEGDINNSQLFSFKFGIPYRHYTTDSTTFNTFFGTKCERVLKIIASADVLKKKKWLSVAIYCKQSKYFIPKATTEAAQETRVLLDYFLEAEYGSFAALLCDLNTASDTNRPKETGINKLLDGNTLYGTYIEVTFVGEPEKNDVYSELQGIIINGFASEPSGTK